MTRSIGFLSAGLAVLFQLGLLAALVSVRAYSQGTYTTVFALAENPISEGGRWIDGTTTGLQWGSVRTIVGTGQVRQATGTIVNGHPPYNDSTAVLAGTWGPNQAVQAVVHTVNQKSSIQEEVELRLRTTITANRITGYEFDYRVTSDGSQYLALVRWNGPLNHFTYLVNLGPGGPGLHDGDVIKATAVGDVLTGYINGVQVMQATDGVYKGGSPGIGFWNLGGTESDFRDYGFTSFTATDGFVVAGPVDRSAPSLRIWKPFSCSNLLKQKPFWPVGAPSFPGWFSEVRNASVSERLCTGRKRHGNATNWE
jgi:hypothetical protein